MHEGRGAMHEVWGGAHNQMCLPIPRRCALSIALGLVLVPIAALTANAAAINRLALSDGTEIAYALALPANFSRSHVYPVLFVFPGGEQTIGSVQAGLERFWETEALRRGFIVISPAAPQGKPFLKDGIAVVPELLSVFLKTYRVKSDKFHLAGHSNGAVSAFRAAVRHPELFHSLTVIAGYPEEDEDFSRLDRLKTLRISMFVGDGDLYWKDGMERTFKRLRILGNAVHFEIIPRNGHFLPDLSFDKSERIFDHIQP